MCVTLPVLPSPPPLARFPPLPRAGEGARGRGPAGKRSRTSPQGETLSEEAHTTHLLDQALAEVQKLAPEQQAAIAALMLEALADEQKWDRAFAESHGALARLAQDVRAKKQAGRSVLPSGSAHTRSMTA